ncbi:hypothetical protein Ancab_018797, partial [Ancistrocladus abbreviatus]
MGNIGQPYNSLFVCDKTASSDDLAEVEKGATAFITPHDEPICPETNLFKDYYCRGFVASLRRPCLRRAPLSNLATLVNQAVNVNPLHSSPTQLLGNLRLIAEHIIMSKPKIFISHSQRGSYPPSQIGLSVKAQPQPFSYLKGYK